MRMRTRLRRLFRLRQRQVVRLGAEAENQIEERFFKRLVRLKRVQRFVALWVIGLLVLLAGVMVQLQALSGYYQSVAYVGGGTYHEGIVGAFTNANPIYATTAADTAVSRLLFAGLLKYDKNGQLTGDLASSWRSNDRGDVYTVTLKQGLSWHDGQPVTARDVVFTYKLIQNPDANSPLQGSWRNISIAAPDDQTITFTLPGALSSFPYSLTTGILPQHILQNVTASTLRSNDFNTLRPIGAGPFTYSILQVTGDTAQTRQEQIALSPFVGYNAGRPQLDRFVIHTYHDAEHMIASYKRGELTAMAGLDQMPRNIKGTEHSLITAAADMVFFRADGVLADTNIRQALVAAADPVKIIQKLGYDTTRVDEPVLKNQFAYAPEFAQQTGNTGKANQLLDQAGWPIGTDGVRAKDGKRLSFSLTALDTAENRLTAETLKGQWRAVGVDVKIDYRTNSSIQDAVTYHAYEALLYGITIGPDPDVFAYWHGTQADIRSTNRLNFSEYKSTAVDTALEAGRARDDQAIRIAKYRPFLQAWQTDAPALGLYQPRFLYITRGVVDGLDAKNLVSPADRYADVNTWKIRQAKVTTQ